MREAGIIMAAGLGTRMYPLTLQMPKPLIKVNGIPMIETMIEGMKRRGLIDIYIVVGYLKEKFDYLLEAYPGVCLIENTEYREKNNISSIYAALDIIRSYDCFICEGDIYVADQSVFQKAMQQSCYYGKMIEGDSDDWLFDTDESQRITHIHKGGTDKYNMAGIAWFANSDARMLAEGILKAYEKEGHETLYWDEIADNLLTKIDMRIIPVEAGQLIEIDTEAELRLAEEKVEK